MAQFIMNGVTFSGLPNGTGNQNAWQPTSYKPIIERIGSTLPAADGTRNRVERGTTKRRWELGWEKVNNATKLTIEGLAAIATTWGMTGYDGVAYPTVQTEEPADIDWAGNDPAGNPRWDIKLTIYQK